MSRLHAIAIAGAVGLGMLAGVARAGGSPATTAIVINAHSTLSLAVGLHYAEARGIPSSNLLFLEGLDGADTVSFEQFLAQIERPVRAFLDARSSASRIDTIALSVDLPYGVELRSLLQGREVPQWVTPRAATSGLLYLAGFHDLQQLGWLNLDANPYARASISREDQTVRVALEPDGRPFRESTAAPAAMVVSLGWIGARGNRIEEVLRALDRSVASDGSRPDGSVYLMQHSDIRARTRAPYFELTKARLAALDRRAEILSTSVAGEDGVLPRNKADVIGLVAGIADFDWERSGSQCLPGAIAEHLTSFGAAFDQGGQTKLAAFVRAGVAGTSGTVMEPYALAPKFPHPLLHAYYAQGFSLAEAFHLAVASPYQLLIVGDPLARPMAQLAALDVDGLPEQTSWSASRALELSASTAQAGTWQRIELWSDGQRIATSDESLRLRMKAGDLGPGGHEIHVLAIQQDLACTRTWIRRVVEVVSAADAFGGWLRESNLTWGEDLKLRLQHAQAERLELWRGDQFLMPFERAGDAFTAHGSSLRLGPGTSWLHVRAFRGDALIDRSAYQRCSVQTPAPATALSAEMPRGWLPGLRAQCRVDGRLHELGVGTLSLGDDRGLADRWKGLGGTVEEVLFEGDIRLDEGWNQLRLVGCREAQLELSGMQQEFAARTEAPTQRWCGYFAAGWHRFRLRWIPHPGAAPALFVQGSGSATAIEGERLRHAHPDAASSVVADGIVAGDQDLKASWEQGVGAPIALTAEEGLVLRWNKPLKQLASVAVLFPEGDREAKPPASAWFVEVRSNAKGKWTEVKHARAVICPALARPLNKNQATAWISFEFDPTGAREVRLRPVLDKPRQVARVRGVLCFEAVKR